MFRQLILWQNLICPKIRVILILDLFRMVPRYLETRFKKERNFILVCILNSLLLILPLREMSIMDISWA